MSGMTQIDVTLATYKAIEAARLSFSESHDEIVQRILTGRRPSRIANANRQAPPATRRRGNVSVDLFGRSVPVANLKGAYIAILNGLLRHKPSLFELLAHQGTSRRKWIARAASELYAESPHLAADHAFAIGGDWFVDTNLSRKQIEQRLTVATRLAGYRFGDDVSIVEGPVAFVP